MDYKCPHCDKVFDVKRNLNRHIARVHPDKSADNPPGPAPADPVPPPALPPPVAPSGKIKVKAPPRQPEQTYHCVDCGHEPITKGTPACPSCGAPLDWSGIGGA